LSQGAAKQRLVAHAVTDPGAEHRAVFEQRSHKTVSTVQRVSLQRDEKIGRRRDHHDTAETAVGPIQAAGKADRGTDCTGAGRCAGDQQAIATAGCMTMEITGLRHVRQIVQRRRA